MSQISVISKLTGVETTSEGTQVTLSHSSIVELNVERASVSHFARNGNDLLVTLHSGEVITGTGAAWVSANVTCLPSCSAASEVCSECPGEDSCRVSAARLNKGLDGRS